MTTLVDVVDVLELLVLTLLTFVLIALWTVLADDCCPLVTTAHDDVDDDTFVCPFVVLLEDTDCCRC